MFHPSALVFSSKSKLSPQKKSARTSGGGVTGAIGGAIAGGGIPGASLGAIGGIVGGMVWGPIDCWGK